jgi:membrane-bound lytic murein transglycosylase D
LPILHVPKLIYTVKVGDNISLISGWYRVGVGELKNWNNIYRTHLRVGQKIVVYVNSAKSEYYSKINTLTFQDKQALIGQAVVTNTQPAPSVEQQTEETDGEFITYTVRNGDTIWDIVKMYDNVTTSQILALNNISAPGKIKVGQKLKIKKKT